MTIALDIIALLLGVIAAELGGFLFAWHRIAKARRQRTVVVPASESGSAPVPDDASDTAGDDLILGFLDEPFAPAAEVVERADHADRGEAVRKRDDAALLNATIKTVVRSPDPLVQDLEIVALVTE